MRESGAVLAVIGGSRWGRTTLSVLANLRLPFDRVVAVSQFNTAVVQSHLDQLTSSVPFEVISTLDEALKKYNIHAAIVVNAAEQHFQTALRLLGNSIPVLIEKPLVQSLAQMKILIDEARKKQVSIVPGLSYRFCSYLENFHHAVFERGVPARFYLQWVDSPNEKRYGEVKKHDASINVVQDVMPHVWTILSRGFRCRKLWVDTLQARDDNNNHVVIGATMDDMQGEILLNRDGFRRQRRLSAEYDNGMLTLDFSMEPGTLFLNKKTLSGDADWQQKPRPLARQLEHFFSVFAQKTPCEKDFQDGMASVACAEQAMNLLKN